MFVGSRMDGYPEQRAALARLAQGLAPPVIPQPRDVWALAEWLGPCLTIRQELGAVPLFSVRRDGGARITIPLLANERAESRLLLEEIAHYLCRSGYPSRPYVHPQEACGALTLDALREADEEHEARRFVDAYLLPAAALRRIRTQADAADLVWEHGIEPDRIERAAVRRPSALALPPWAAWHSFHVRRRDGRHGTWIRIDGAASCEFPVRARESTAVLRQLHLDLAALREEEFALKHGEQHAGDWQPAGMHWSELVEGVRV